MDQFARGREVFADDPRTTLERAGIREADFSRHAAWDQYPIVGQFLKIWDATSRYVTTFVDETYRDDSAVTADAALQAWMKASASRWKGNLSGLPEMNSRDALRDVLTSILYRIRVHGVARLNPALNPAETFVCNFPPCLQASSIPAPDTSISTSELLRYLPTTDTLGKMVDFYFIFVFSLPYERFLPSGGWETNLFFPGGPASPRNAALIAFRREIDDFLRQFAPAHPQPEQWPLNVET